MKWMLLSNKDHGDGKDVVKGRTELSKLSYWENGMSWPGRKMEGAKREEKQVTCFLSL